MKSISKTLAEGARKRLTLRLAAAMAAAVMLCIVACDSDAIYDNIKAFSVEEEVYPAKFDTIFGKVGFERVEIDLRRDGRIPSSKIIMGKAKKTVVVYDEDSSTPVIIKIDSICSWVNITGLTEPRLYRFKIYTEDQYGDRSTPQEISLVPYTAVDRDILAQGILEPSPSKSATALVMEWGNTLHTIMMEYHGMTYQYDDADGVSHADTLGLSPRIYASNLPAGEEVTFNIKYKMVPIMDDGSKLLDTLWIERPFIVQMPSAGQPFVPVEYNTIKANGLTEFTLDEAATYTKLVYPMNMTTFADMFYFNSVNTLDLTGKGLEGTLEKFTVALNSTTSIVGGGAWQEFMMPFAKPQDIRSSTGQAPEGLETLRDILDAGQITKIYYIPKSMGLKFDEFLQPYKEAGIVEWLDYGTPEADAFFPNRVFISSQFFVDGATTNHSWDMLHYYSGGALPNSQNSCAHRGSFIGVAAFDPTNERVNGNPVNLKLNNLIQSDGKNIYKTVVVSKNCTFEFDLPRDWRYDNKRYPYLKGKLFIGCDKSVVSGSRSIYRSFRVRSMNYTWSFGNQTAYGQYNWESSSPTVPEAYIGNDWYEFTIDMSNNYGEDSGTDTQTGRRNRVYAINPGMEQSSDLGNPPATFDINSTDQIVLYWADLRLCKTMND
ncbi:MAG: hypothetical protein LBR06_04700 [Bacteroidales bacterium]|jgi:hypothetical protein|nr:hypothetical protein [Bacteroidales bacterium]